MLNRPPHLLGPDTPHVVSAIVISGEGSASDQTDLIGRILLAKRAQSVDLLPGQWCFPSGHRKNGETPSAALKREILEELGIEVNITQSPIVEAFSIVRQTDHEGRVRFQPYALSVYIVRDWTGMPHNNEPDSCDGIQWMDLGSVVALNNKATVIDAVLGAMISKKQRLLFELGPEKIAEFISSINDEKDNDVRAVFDALSAWEEGAPQYTLEGCLRLFDFSKPCSRRLFRHAPPPPRSLRIVHDSFSRFVMTPYPSTINVR